MIDASLIVIFLITFCVMEFLAWFLHKFVMHGFLWVLHYDHHNPNKGSTYQRNDFFAAFFAVPSFLLLLFGSINENRIFSAIGFGIMAYGFVYFIVHEVIIHRRFKIGSFSPNWYTRGLNAAHKIHHASVEKEDGRNFGMLIVPVSYFRVDTMPRSRRDAKPTNEARKVFSKQR